MINEIDIDKVMNDDFGESASFNHQPAAKATTQAMSSLVNIACDLDDNP